MVISQVKSSVDEQNQYSRRDNVVFSNLKVDEEHEVGAQVQKLCKELGVEVTPEHIVAAHPLPSKQGKPKRFITRFTDRRIAKDIFAKRRATKSITPEKKEALAHNPAKGFAIQPSITPKRAKLLAQAQTFCKDFEHDSCWVNTNNGKIMIKVAGSQRGVHVRDTGTLVGLSDGSYNPAVEDWYFCSPPYFPETNNRSLDITVGQNRFSPLSDRYQPY